jgi:hypothetical protein
MNMSWVGVIDSCIREGGRGQGFQPQNMNLQISKFNQDPYRGCGKLEKRREFCTRTLESAMIL